jgi:hypothetical protein
MSCMSTTVKKTGGASACMPHAGVMAIQPAPRRYKSAGSQPPFRATSNPAEASASGCSLPRDWTPTDLTRAHPIHCEAPPQSLLASDSCSHTVFTPFTVIGSFSLRLLDTVWNHCQADPGLCPCDNRSWKVMCPYSRSQYKNRGKRASEQRELSGSLMKCHGCWYRSRSRVHSLEREGTASTPFNTGASFRISHGK